MPDGLYERDILQWSEEQARLLPWPAACPWTLDDLLVPRQDPRLLAARLAA